MSKVVDAEYDAASNCLRLSEPLEGFADHELVSVIVHHADTVRPWSDLEGILNAEDGEKFARAIEEAFPTEPVKK